MILVAGLAVAGLAGIAAAFYFSMRPGDSRARSSGPDRGAGRRPPASRSRTAQVPSGRSDPSASPPRSASAARSAGGARSANGRTADRTGPAGSSTVIDLTGPQPALEDSEPPVTGHRARHGSRRDDAPDGPAPDRRAAAPRSHAEEPHDAAATARSRRRVGWRKGSEVDEELWPTEAFGGVTDEQFWDDLASDKPLTTTARTAQPEGVAKRRPSNAGPLPDLYAGNDRGRAVQPAVTSPAATSPYPTATQPSPIATQPVRADQQSAEPRGRSRAAASAYDDPLTSPAYSLRRRGSVDGRAYSSSRRSADLTRDQYEAAVAQATQAFSLADARAAGGGYSDGAPPYRQFDRPSPGANGRGRADGYRSDPLASEPLRPDPLRPGDGYGGAPANTVYPHPQQPYAPSTSTPPSGERYGYGNPVSSWAQGVPAGQGGDPRRANGGWSAGQAIGNGAGDGSWGTRQARPPANGYRGPYDPRGYDRRLTGLP